ncbi:MAG: hypothetical protein JWR47_977 [Phenylobacterium sp.]|jgi:hypothetical protein|nr:hypothetical protein [Phenylobacterium sp.]MDB5434720.1 hypothetical protein [Phenylobacterium sp.]MDB5464703.1 hypothetical protein [Phenylobacterium sp.]MDB5495988.1 hypothetical protein [Phenylobacterium sp.]
MREGDVTPTNGEIWLLCTSASLTIAAEIAVIWAAYLVTRATPPWYAVPVTLAALAPLGLVIVAHATRAVLRSRTG